MHRRERATHNVVVSEAKLRRGMSVKWSDARNLEKKRCAGLAKALTKRNTVAVNFVCLARVEEVYSQLTPRRKKGLLQQNTTPQSTNIKFFIESFPST